MDKEIKTGNLDALIFGMEMSLHQKADALNEYKLLIVNSEKLYNIPKMCEMLKTKAELPNENSHEYNMGYVRAINDIINFLTK